jgi:uncharacterized DUF497 family protein
MEGVTGFDWDGGNEAKSFYKHGVGRETIEAFFARGPRTAPDRAHSSVEPRYLAVGRTAEGRWMIVSFTLRQRDGASLLRPISARYMHAREVEDYEKAD